jgi:hypothetical protein
MAGTVACDCAKIEAARAQGRDAWTEMVISSRFADVELVDLHSRAPRMAPSPSHVSVATARGSLSSPSAIHLKNLR